ncbi:MAG: FixH family protein [Flavobacteriales bacterium]|nr:FixH family protein [Flavobacteriales bacterium]
MFKKFTWGHGVVLALLAFIVFILSLLYKYQSQDNVFDLVTDDYYEEELVYQNEIDAKNRANKLSETPMVTTESEGFKIEFPKEFNQSNTSGKILLRHAYIKDKDVKSKLILNSDNQMFIPSTVLDKASYTLIISWEKDSLNYRKDYDIKWE